MDLLFIFHLRNNYYQKEISIPGFLHLDSKSQIRIDQKLGSGGSGLIYSGVLLDPELISQQKTDKIALKQIPCTIIYFHFRYKLEN